MQRRYESEVRRVVDLLAYAVRRKGVTRRSIEEKMGVSRGYLSELLSGEIDLRLSQILMILEALEVHPRDFYRIVYNYEGTLAQEELALAVAQGSDAPSDPGAEELLKFDARVAASLMRLLSSLNTKPATES